MLGAQGMDTGVKDRIDPGEAGLRHQYEKYYAGGYPVWWYCWTRGPSQVDIKRKYQNLMHEFYTGQGPVETITNKTIIHSCNVKISYQVSSFPENNDALTCPNCGMALGVEGIRGSERIDEGPPPEYIVIAGQKIYKPTLIGQDASGDWWAVWNNVRYWIRHWDIIQSMENQEVPRGDVSPYPMAGDNKYFKSIPDFPEELLYKETITTKVITCSKCNSKLELKVSSIAEKNTEQYCPVCGEPAD
jgi:predicted RNA-binding Zn-ribbon protein involved in translation (DUF1610 family)